MIWESTFLIIQNCKMYEKLNEGKGRTDECSNKHNKMHMEVVAVKV